MLDVVDQHAEGERLGTVNRAHDTRQAADAVDRARLGADLVSVLIAAEASAQGPLSRLGERGEQRRADPALTHQEPEPFGHGLGRDAVAPAHARPVLDHRLHRVPGPQVLSEQHPDDRRPVLPRPGLVGEFVPDALEQRLGVEILAVGVRAAQNIDHRGAHDRRRCERYERLVRRRLDDRREPRRIRRGAHTPRREPLREQVAQEQARIVHRDIDHRRAAQADIPEDREVVRGARARGPRDPHRVPPVLDHLALVVDREPVAHARDEGLETQQRRLSRARARVPARVEIKAQAVGVEVHARHLGAVPAVELVGRPRGVHPLGFEDPVVDDDRRRGPDGARRGRGRERVSQRVEHPVNGLGRGAQIEEGGIAQTRIAVPDHDDAVGVPAEAGLEDHVGPEHQQRGAGGEQFLVGRGDQGGRPVLAVKNIPGSGIPDMHADRRGRERTLRVDRAVDAIRERLPQRGHRERRDREQPEQQPGKGLGTVRRCRCERTQRADSV